MKLICKTWTNWSSIELLLRSLDECKCICIFLHSSPPCLLLNWQTLGLGDWRQNQIKATHQPITNRTENVSLVTGCETRWKVSLRVCISKPGFRVSGLPVLSKQIELTRWSMLMTAPASVDALDGKWLTLYFDRFLWPFTLLLFSLSLHSFPDIITMRKSPDVTIPGPTELLLLQQPLCCVALRPGQWSLPPSLSFKLTLNSHKQWLWLTVHSLL